jgi:putative Holliday junction resolvase
MTDRPELGRIAGIDFGTVRLGVALTDTERRLASGLENYTRRGTDADARYFARLASEEAIALFVVGLPVHTDGHESQKSSEARRFAAWLGDVTGVPVEMFDERFTTQEAEQHLQDAGLTKARRKKRLDMLAAQLMLTAYLEAGCPECHQPKPLDDS